MKKLLFLNIFSIILLTTSYLSNVSAENYTRWDLPNGAIARIGKGEIDAIQYSPDGTQLGVGTSIGIWLYDAKTYQELNLLKKPEESDYTHRNISFSPDGSTLATIRDNMSGIKLLDTESGKLKKSLMMQFGLSLGIKIVLFSPDGATLASNDYKRLLLWDVVTGKYRTLEEHAESIEGLAFSPDGRTIATGSMDQTIILWDVVTGSVKHTLKGHTDSVTSVSFSPDGKTLASGSADNTIRFWDIETGTHVKTFKESEVNVTQISFSPNGQFILSWGKGNIQILLWDVETGEYNQVDDQTKRRISVCFSPDGNMIAAAHRNHTIDFFDLTTGEHKKRIAGNTFDDLRYSIGVFPDVVLSPDGSKCVSMNNDKSLKLCDISTGQVKLLTSHTPENKYIRLNRLLFSSDSRKLVGMYSNGYIRLWDANTGKELYVAKGKRSSEKNHASEEHFYLDAPTLGLAFSPDSQILASARLNHSIHLWDTTSGNLRHSLDGHTGRIGSLSFSSNGRTLVSASHDGTLRLWNAITGELKQTISNRLLAKQQTSKPIAVTTVALNPEGDRVASGSQNGTIVMWDVVTGEQTGVFTGHVDAISEIFFSPDGGKIVSTSNDGSVRLWDVSTRQQEYVIAGYRLTDWKVFLYKNGMALASEIKRGPGTLGKPTVDLWNLDTGKRIKILTGHNKEVTSIDFSDDGRTFISGSRDGTVLVWDILNIIQEVN